jgi:hypothetical protein
MGAANHKLPRRNEPAKQRTLAGSITVTTRPTRSQSIVQSFQTPHSLSPTPQADLPDFSESPLGRGSHASL